MYAYRIGYVVDDVADRNDDTIATSSADRRILVVVITILMIILLILFKLGHSTNCFDNNYRLRI